MSHPTAVPYNNRFRSSGSSSGGNNHPVALNTEPRLPSVSQGVGIFDHSSPFPLPGSFQGPSSPEHHAGHVHRMTSFEHPIPVSTQVVPDQQTVIPDTGDVSRPMSPGKPRRLSRQISANTRRQFFADSRQGPASGEHGGQMVTSVDPAGCDEVFVEVAGGDKSPRLHALVLPDTSLFRSKSTLEMTLSTSSTASILPNPYNRINHRIHSTIWCCSCFYLLFFCCLPAIHYMEQCDVEYQRNNQKRAQCLGRTASFMFFTGTLIALSFFALIFFLAIFFTVYY